MSIVYILLGLWRSWLGGGIGKDWPVDKGGTLIRYAALAALVTLAVWPDWLRGLIDFAALWFLARGLPHGPMNRYPLGPKGGDVILRLVGGPGGGLGRYLSYAGLRYGLPCVIWAAALWWADLAWTGPLMGAVAIIVSYVGFTQADDLPTFVTPGDEAGNWSEITGWTLAGCCLAIADVILLWR